MRDAQEIVDLETRFWDTMVSQDVEAATAMRADEAIVTGPQGGARISRGDFTKMMEGADWTLDYAGRSRRTMAFADELTAAHPDRVLRVEVGVLGSDADIDVEADLERVGNLLTNGRVP